MRISDWSSDVCSSDLQISGFNVERLGNAARSLALGRYAFNQAREHALIRKQFNRLLCEFQGIQWKFSDMWMQLEQAQLLLYRAVLEGIDGLPPAQSAATAKLPCNQADRRSVGQGKSVSERVDHGGRR